MKTTTKRLVDFLRASNAISDLEKDILDTYDVLHEVPFDNTKAQKQISGNDSKHIDVAALVNSEPTTVPKPASAITELDRTYILGEQLKFLCMKELNESAVELQRHGFYLA